MTLLSVIVILGRTVDVLLNFLILVNQLIDYLTQVLNSLAPVIPVDFLY